MDRSAAPSDFIINKYCLHDGVRRYHCKKHNTGYCIHNILKYKCDKCHVTREQKKLMAPAINFCMHNGVRKHCCKTCIHNIRKSQCIECTPTAFCKHRKHKYRCRECGTDRCIHDYQKHNCPKCLTGIYADKKDYDDHWHVYGPKDYSN